MSKSIVSEVSASEIGSAPPPLLPSSPPPHHRHHTQLVTKQLKRLGKYAGAGGYLRFWLGEYSTFVSTSYIPSSWYIFRCLIFCVTSEIRESFV